MAKDLKGGDDDDDPCDDWSKTPIPKPKDDDKLESEQ